MSHNFHVHSRVDALGVRHSNPASPPCLCVARNRFYSCLGLMVVAVLNWESWCPCQHPNPEPFLPPSGRLRWQDTVDDIGDSRNLMIALLVLVLMGLVLHWIGCCTSCCFAPRPSDSIAAFPAVGAPASAPPPSVRFAADAGHSPTPLNIQPGVLSAPPAKY